MVHLAFLPYRHLEHIGATPIVLGFEQLCVNAMCPIGMLNVTGRFVRNQ